MTDRYTHVNLHDERAAIEDFPDYTIEKQRAVKTGTDDNFLFSRRTNTDSNGKTTAETAQEGRLERTGQATNTPKMDYKSAILKIGQDSAHLRPD